MGRVVKRSFTVAVIAAGSRKHRPSDGGWDLLKSSLFRCPLIGKSSQP